MERNNRQRLITEADALIGKSDLNNEEKENLTRNIRFFLSEVKYDETLKDTKWQWFDEDEEGHGLDLVWNSELVKGCFGFYADNGHGYNFEYGNGECCQMGGVDGEYGFFCSCFIDEFENELKYIGYI